MIKIILHGGGGTDKKKMRLLIDEIKKSTPNGANNIRAIIIPFARDRADWTDIYHKYQQRYASIGTRVDFQLASIQAREFIDQITSSDIIFITGGTETLLKERLRKINASIFKNKTIVAVSAGANIFSRYYYSNDRNKIEKGLYQLPIKTICHYDESKIKQLNKLILYKDELNTFTLAIREDNFTVIFVSNKMRNVKK